MKYILLLTMAVVAVGTACEVQSGITKKSLEEYNPTPTPQRTATPVEIIDPADIATVDTASAGPSVNVNTPEEAKKAKCDKYNRVIVNGDAKEVTIGGNCKQIMLNGDGNKITVGAVSEMVFNGHNNTVEHVKYINGKKPMITDSGTGNTITKVAPPTPTPAK